MYKKAPSEKRNECIELFEKAINHFYSKEFNKADKLIKDYKSNIEYNSFEMSL